MCTGSIQAGRESLEVARFSAAHAPVGGVLTQSGVRSGAVPEATDGSLSLQPVGMSDRRSREAGQESGEAPELRRTQVQPGVRSGFKVTCLVLYSAP